MDNMETWENLDSLLAIGMGEIILSIGIAIILIIAIWKIFEKAGEKGRKVFIPFYNMYLYYKIAGQKKLFWIAVLPFLMGGIWLFVSIICFLLQIDIAVKRVIIRGLSMLLPIAGMASLVTHCIVQIKMAEKFGKSTGFGIGLIFLSGIFIPILGFGSAQYQGNVKKSSSAEPQQEDPTIG